MRLRCCSYMFSCGLRANYGKAARVARCRIRKGEVLEMRYIFPYFPFPDSLLCLREHYTISFRHVLSLRGMHTVRQGRCPPFGQTANRRRYNVCRHYTMSSGHTKCIYALSLRGMRMICQRNCPPAGRTANQRW